MKGIRFFAVLGVSCILAAGTSARAATTEDFFAGGDASAGWVQLTPAPPGSTEDASIALRVNADSSTDYDDYAGVELVGVDATAPEDPPSFAFNSSVSDAGSGGSPRLVILFDDGAFGNVQLRPLGWTPNTWVTIDGAVTDATQGWDNAGGTCGYLYNKTYAEVLACHADVPVLAVYIVTDSGWFHPGGYTHYIDDIAYGDTTLSYPTQCADDFTGNHETGPASSTVHGVVEPALGPAALTGTVHGVNCDVVVPLGL